MSAGASSGPKLSVVVTVHDEAAQLAECLERLTFADELIVVLDRCTDASKEIAAGFGAALVEGAWPLEGERRNAGIEAASGDWVLEVDADERAPAELGEEIRSTIATAAPGHFLVPFDNYIGRRRVRYGWGGSWGVSAAPRLFSKGAKRWGPQRVHPALELQGRERTLTTRMVHHVDRDFSDMLRRLDRYTALRAADLREADKPLPPMIWTLRRSVSRFLKCYFRRKGYREGRWGFVIALMAALYPLISHLRAEVEPIEGDEG
jgi:glycosyltransferase involved in cell wall biosynthesis